MGRKDHRGADVVFVFRNAGHFDVGKCTRYKNTRTHTIVYDKTNTLASNTLPIFYIYYTIRCVSTVEYKATGRVFLFYFMPDRKTRTKLLLAK